MPQVTSHLPRPVRLASAYQFAFGSSVGQTCVISDILRRHLALRRKRNTHNTTVLQPRGQLLPGQAGIPADWKGNVSELAVSVLLPELLYQAKMQACT